MSIRHSLMRFATPCSREKFTCTFVGTGRNVRYAFFPYIAGTAAVVGLSRELLLAGTIAGNTWTIT